MSHIWILMYYQQFNWWKFEEIHVIHVDEIPQGPNDSPTHFSHYDFRYGEKISLRLTIPNAFVLRGLRNNGSLLTFARDIHESIYAVDENKLIQDSICEARKKTKTIVSLIWHWIRTNVDQDFATLIIIIVATLFTPIDFFVLATCYAWYICEGETHTWMSSCGSGAIKWTLLRGGILPDY